jgi:hypothetical protein
MTTTRIEGEENEQINTRIDANISTYRIERKEETNIYERKGGIHMYIRYT